MREGVAVWPQRKQRIVGRLSLVEQHRVLFLSWMPYAPGALCLDGSFQPAPGTEAAPADRHLYALHPIPLSDVKARLALSRSKGPGFTTSPGRQQLRTLKV